ncbi:MAG: hypothetical protein IPM42_12510 [Saprospiraceae bacterium]|nr:hypothetical protein [Saprospiraceae bacterium]
MRRVKFLLEGIKNFQKIGSVARSGNAMCEKMAGFIDPVNDKVIIELGAGDGVITQYILDRMHPEGILLAFEINENLYKELCNIPDDRLIPIFDNADKMEYYLMLNNHEKADTIISALPFLVLNEQSRILILSECFRLLKTGGIFIQMHYSLHVRNIYKKIFGNVSVHFVPVNIPPGYVFKSTKPPEA